MDTKMQAEPLQAAAYWYARLAAPDCSAQERAEFEHWLASDARHAQAFASVERMDATVTRLAPNARLAALADAAFADSATRNRGTRIRPRWIAVPLSLAAAVLVFIGAVRLLPELEMRNTPSVSYQTSAGETRALTLSDGSTVRLDVASAIEVQMYKDERRITLTSGRAYFTVAHDVSRPFAVTANGVRTVALGTQFEVQQDKNQVIVTLAEGSVLVSDAGAVVPAWEEKLMPGDQLRVTDGAEASQRRTVNPEHVASWMQGRHVFEHTPLAEAIEEINRYSERKIRLGDPSLAELPIGGNFVAGNGELIASSIAAALPITLVEAGPDEIILFRRYDSIQH
jgi:transmembrane sensor